MQNETNALCPHSAERAYVCYEIYEEHGGMYVLYSEHFIEGHPEHLDL